MKEEKRYKLAGICFIILGIITIIMLKLFNLRFNSPDFDLFIIAPALIIIGICLYLISYDIKRIKN